MSEQHNILTEKQQQALEMVADHLSSKEIAIRLGISSHSVDKRLDEARRKLGASTRKEAARIFFENDKHIIGGDWLTGEPITVPENAANSQNDDDERHNALYSFADVAPIKQHAPWRSWQVAVPEISPERLTLRAKLVLILVGALGLVILALLLLALAQGFQSLL